MGLDCSLSIIAGVHLERKTKINKRTKYNEDTGKPYEIEEEEKYWVIEGTDIKIDRKNDEDLEWNVDGKPMIVYCDYNNENSYFLGISVGRTESHRFSSDLYIEITKYPDQKKKISDFLKERYGYTKEIKLFALLNMSY